MDFIFGTFASDELKVIHHRTARHGVQHDSQLHPRDPLPGQPVILTVQIGTDFTAGHVVCYYTLDGTLPAGSRGTAYNGFAQPLYAVETVWDTIAWGYVTRWQGTLPAQPDGTTVHYRIGAWSGAEPEVFADWPSVHHTAEDAAAAFFRGDALPLVPSDDPGRGRTFTFHVDCFVPPTWAREAVIYQVFVDRFYPGDGRDWLSPAGLDGFFGGTLWGVRDKLDYIADLGATCLWLSPIWPSPSHHGYDVVDYSRVEPRLGGDDALHAVIEGAHARGLRVLLDMVCNHISSEHAVFQAALADPCCPYREWFTFNPSPPGYRAFFGVPTMPQLNLDNLQARQWLVDIARFWLREFDADGFRLDYANGPGPDFWSDFRTGCRVEKPDAFCFGEVIDQPLSLLPYIGRLDGCLDFHTGEAIRQTFAYGTRTEAELERFVERHHAYFAEAGDFVLPTFIDNHDMDRFMFIAQGRQEALRRAAAFQMRLPGPPILYYGTEIGLSQPKGRADGMGIEANRVPMRWDGMQGQDLRTFYRRLIAERRSHPSR